MPLARFRIDEGPHTMDGLRLIARDGNKQVEAFMSRKVMDGGRIRRASWRTSKSFPRSIQCAWQTEPPRTPTDCAREIRARCRVQPPTSLRGGPVL
jgi:hypothetical protein